jgi:hypothetical protein
MVECTFKCNRVTEFDTTYTYELAPVHDNWSSPLWEGAPSGSLTLTVLKSKGKLFHVGDKYKLTVGG